MLQEAKISRLKMRKSFEPANRLNLRDLVNIFNRGMRNFVRQIQSWIGSEKLFKRCKYVKSARIGRKKNFPRKKCPND